MTDKIQPKVVVFSTPTCSFCNMAKSYFREKGVKFTDIDVSRDQAAARRISDADLQINEKRYSIESACVTLIATQQPMARDVRFLAAILEIITELERIVRQHGFSQYASLPARAARIDMTACHRSPVPISNASRSRRSSSSS